MTRRICYISGTRADFGLMASTLQKIKNHPDLDINICVTGMHCLENIGEIGQTFTEVVESGIPVCDVIKTPVLAQRSGSGMARALSIQLGGFIDTFEREKFDIILLLGDRGEQLAAAIAAIHLGIPIVHIHGGEVSGTVDEPVRHAISKLAHYHFTSNKFAYERLIKMGEPPHRVFCTGAPGLDGIKNFPLTPKNVLFEQHNLNPDIKTCLMLYHPVLQEEAITGEQTLSLLKIIHDKKIQAVVLQPNTDGGSAHIVNAIEAYKSKKLPLFRFFDHFERTAYLSWLQACDFMIGNSSSGIIEACSFNKPVLDIGTRQTMREISENVQRIPHNPLKISKAIDKILQDDRPKNWTNIYGDAHTGEKIVALLSSISLDQDVLCKINSY